MTKTLSFILCALVFSLSAVLASEPPADEIARLNALLEQGDCSAVLEATPEAIKKQPKNPDLLVIEGNCLLVEGRTRTQVFDRKRFEELRLSLGLDSLPPRFANGLHHVETRYDKKLSARGLDRFRQAIKLAPERKDILVGSFAAFVNAGRLKEALALVVAHKSALGQREIQDLSRVATDLMNTGQVEDARTLAEELAAAFPSDPSPHAASGLISLEALLAKPAIANFSQALELGSPSKRVNDELARLLLYARDYEDAVTVLVPIAQSDIAAMTWLAVARENLSVESSRPIWAEVVTRAKTLKTPPKGLDAVIKHHHRILSSTTPPTAEMRLRAAEMFQSEGLLFAAVAEADAALRIDAKNREAWLFLTRFYRNQGLLDLALDGLDALHSIAPDDAGLSLQRAQVLLGLRHYEDAAKAAADASAAGIDGSFEQGIAALGLDQEEQAAAFFRKTVERGGPNADRAQSRL